MIHDVSVDSAHATTGKPTYFHAIGVPSAGTGCSIHHNFCYNILPADSADQEAAAIYTDTGSTLNLSISDNVFTNVNYGILVHNSTSGALLDNWLISQNVIKANTGMLINGTSGIHFSKFKIEGNVITGRTSPALGIRCDYVDGVLAINNTITLTGTPFSFNNCTSVAQHLNYNSSGAVVGTPTGFTSAEVGTILAEDIVGVGTLPDGVLSANVPLLALDNTWAGVNTFGQLELNGSVGVNGEFLFTDSSCFKKILTTDGSGSVLPVTLTAGQSVRLNAAGTAIEAFTPSAGGDTALASGTALTIGTVYHDTLSANRTLTFSGSPVNGGPPTVLRLIVTGGPRTLTIPSCYRLGENTAVTSLVLSTGYHELSWQYAYSVYWLADSGGTTVRYGTATLVAGTVTVADTLIGSTTLVRPLRDVDGGTIGCSYSVTRSAGVSFTLTSKDKDGSTQTADTSTLSFELIDA